ncbi:MAG: exo-alpha-sialidase, partial [Candidatus Thermoplasmatota archaeon]|nr:exo-alpha-sialidase [Candidatus Thermoplasmatota archaeon]
DGLTFEKVGIAIHNGEPGSMEEMVSNSAIIELNNGSYRMIYEGRDDNYDRRLFSAFSDDGYTWSKEEGIRFQDYGDGKPDELFTSVPETIRLDNGDLRMYYTRGVSSATAISHDEGLTWEKEGNLDLGRIVIDPDILRLDDGSYKLFFTTFDEEFGVGAQYVMSASSYDGITLTIDSGKRLEPISINNLLLDPDIIRLSDGPYRMYFSEMQDDGSIRILSAISS